MGRVWERFCLSQSGSKIKQKRVIKITCGSLTQWVKSPHQYKTTKPSYLYTFSLFTLSIKDKLILKNNPTLLLWKYNSHYFQPEFHCSWFYHHNHWSIVNNILEIRLYSMSSSKGVVKKKIPQKWLSDVILPLHTIHTQCPPAHIKLPIIHCLKHVHYTTAVC